MRNILLAVSILSLTGCMATGPSYNSAAMDSGKTQMIIYRPSAILLSATVPSVEVNGVEKCALSVNGYMVVDIKPGETNLSVDYWATPGTSRLSFNAKAGHKYYVKVSPNSGKALTGAFAGYLGLAASEVSSEQKGSFMLESVSSGAAQAALKETKATCK